MTTQSLYIGLMSGTSLDGVDGVLATFQDDTSAPHLLASAYLAFPANLRTSLMALQAAGENEIHRESLAANELVDVYAKCVQLLLREAALPPEAIRAIGCHGQTIRHCPHLGYTRQTNNPSLLAEVTGIDVIADFRSRDIAAGGQGAPLVPAFHQAVFAKEQTTRVVANIGGMSNISIIQGHATSGFDTGPGNVLMDAWALQHRGEAYDAGGSWAASGRVIPELLAAMRKEPFFAQKPPKSTGRDLFDQSWLVPHLANFANANAADVQATLAALTAHTLVEAIARHAPEAEAIYVCGGGAYNTELIRLIQEALPSYRLHASLSSTQTLDVSPQHVEALAFAWLAQRFDTRNAGNLPAVTGARGLRILGALYPAG